MKHLIKLLPLLALSFTAEQSIAQLVIQSGATVTTTGNAVVALNNTDMENAGTVQQAPGGKFIFTGTQSNTVSGTAEPHFSAVEVAKTGSGQLTISQNINVSDSVHFVSGNMQMDNAVLHLGNTGILSGENESSRLTSINNGAVQALASVSGSASMLNIGNLGASLTTSNALGNVEISRMNTAATNPDNSAFTGIERIYFIDPQNNTNLNATLRFYYLDAELNGKDENTLTLWKSEDGTNWTVVGADTRNANNNYVEKTGINDFSYWALTDGDNPLPLSLISFNAECSGNNVSLHWVTTKEDNITSFIVEQSSDAKQWNDIQKIDFKNGQHNYSCTATASNAYYRLKIMEVDGKSQYSDVVKSNCGTIENNIKIWPNPATDFVNINTQNAAAGNLQVQVMDAKGALINAFSWQSDVGANNHNLNISGLAAGIYYIKCRDTANGIDKSFKIIKEK